MGAGQAEFMAQKIAQQQANADRTPHLLAVDRERHFDARIVRAFGNRRPILARAIAGSRRGRVAPRPRTSRGSGRRARAAGTKPTCSCRRLCVTASTDARTAASTSAVRARSVERRFGRFEPHRPVGNPAGGEPHACARPLAIELEHAADADKRIIAVPPRHLIERPAGAGRQYRQPRFDNDLVLLARVVRNDWKNSAAGI